MSQGKRYLVDKKKFKQYETSLFLSSMRTFPWQKLCLLISFAVIINENFAHMFYILGIQVKRWAKRQFSKFDFSIEQFTPACCINRSFYPNQISII